MTGGEAKMLASNQSRMAVVSAMVPICLEQSKMDPQVAVTLAKLKDTSSYQRNDVLMQAGWATMPGSEQPDRMVANACVEALSANF